MHRILPILDATAAALAVTAASGVLVDQPARAPAAQPAVPAAAGPGRVLPLPLPALRQQLAAARAALQAAPADEAAGGRVTDDVLNRDTLGLPQNEESVSSCPGRPDTVL